MKKITLLAAFFAAFTMNAQIFFEDFNAEIIDSNEFAQFDAVDQDGDGENWEVFDSANVGDGVSSLFTGYGADSDSWEGSPLAPDNFLITKDPIDLTAVTGTTISFIVGTYQVNGTFLDDKYSIYMTETNDVNDILAATPVDTRLVADDVTAIAGDGSDSAALVSVDASDYDGQMVYLTFRHYDSVDVNSVLLDDITVDGVLGITDESFNGFNYFVDSNNNLNLSANTALNQVEVYNAIGQQVVSQKLSNTDESISLASLETGIYIAKVNIDGASKSFKIIKK